MKVLTGISVSRGIARGTAFLYRPFVPSVSEGHFSPEQASAQLDRYRSAVAQGAAELAELAARLSAQENPQSMIFEAQQEILQDEEMDACVRSAIEEEFSLPEWAVHTVFTQFSAILAKARDPLIAARSADILDVRNRLLRILSGAPACDFTTLPQHTVLLAVDLLPSDTAMLDLNRICAIATEQGSYTSHTAILARSLNLPAVLGVHGAMEDVEPGADVIVDALAGSLIVAPDAASAAKAQTDEAAYLRRQRLEEAYLPRPAVTTDGCHVSVGINIGSPEADYTYCDYCGLFRTEFLFMESDHIPTEKEQYTRYLEALRCAGGKTVTLRTLDIGGDKTLKYMELPKEANPFLGKRALRLCFDRQDLFRTQLRAALRASVEGDLQIMFPMVGSLDDFRRAKAVTLDVMRELDGEGIPYRKDTPIGMMIEIPSIAMIAEEAAKEVDFASIGTNDLCQYLCAADRMNPDVSPYYQSFSPAMLRTLNLIAQGFVAAGKPLSVCGELGGDPRAAVLLVGMGVRKLSMAPTNLASVKAALCNVSLQEAACLAEQALRLPTQDEVLHFLSEHGIGQ